MTSLLDQDLSWLMLGGLIATIFSWIASRNGYYWLPQQGSGVGVPLPLKYVAGAFGLFFFIEMMIVPEFFTSWRVFTEQTEGEPSVQQKIVLDMIGALSTLLILVWFYGVLPANCRRQILCTKEHFQWIIDPLMGIVTWVIAYPWVFVVSQIMQVILLFIHGPVTIDQIAVERVKAVADDPLMLALVTLFVILIVPMIEELLFRGFLQTYLKQVFGRSLAIVLTSIIFAGFHFADKQGFENLMILGALFVLSCYLGFIRERQQSLLAPIALHGTFNAVTILIIKITP